MNILVNTAALLTPLTGIGNYTRQLVREFRRLAPENEYRYLYGYFMSSRVIEGASIPLFESVHRKVRAWNLPYRLLRRIRRETLKLHLSSGSYDVYFEPNYIPELFSAKRSITTVHDFSFHLYPEWHPKERVEHFSREFFVKIRRADAIVTDSSFIREQAREILKFPEDRIYAIPIGVDRELFRPYPVEILERFRRAKGLPDRYILFVGSLEPRKNLLRLLESYRALPEALRKSHPLVLAGPDGWRNDEIHRSLAATPGTRMLGYVTEQELAYLFNLATVFVFPSLYEGFGLPPLEAMACGCPVIVSRAASLPEVVGEAGAYVDPLRVDDIAGALLRLLENDATRKQLSRQGLRRAADFSWGTTASRLLALFKGEHTEGSAAESRSQPLSSVN